MKNLESFEMFSENALQNCESIQISGGTLYETGCCDDGKTPKDLYDSETKRYITVQC